MEFLSLDKLLFTYPQQEDVNIQSIITSKQEFINLKSIPNESQVKKLKQGEFYNHQKFIHNFLSVYDILTIIADPGTGKTGSAFGFTEKIKRESKNYQNYTFVQNFLMGKNPYIKRVYVLAPNDVIVSQIKQEIAKKYSKPGDYDVNLISRGTETGKKRILTNMLAHYYEFYTYTTFGTKIEKMSDEDIIDTFSNCIFVIDEAHNLRLESKTYLKYALGHDTILSNKKINKIASKKRDKTLTYKRILRVFDQIKRSKIISMTATPIINNTHELASLFNLILKEKIPLSFNFDNLSIEDIEPYLRGKISYIRKEDGCTKTKYIGEKIHIGFDKDTGKDIYSEIVVYYTDMGIFQATAYLDALQNYSQESEQLKTMNEKIGKTTSPFSNDLREISLMVYPDGSYGKEITKENGKKTGFTRFIKFTNQKKERRINGKKINGENWNWTSKHKKIGKLPFESIEDNEGNIIEFDSSILKRTLYFEDFLESCELFRLLSSKYVSIVENVHKNIQKYNSISKFGLGTFYIYSESVEGSGAIPFTLFLEKNDLVKFERFNVFKSPIEIDQNGKSIINEKLLPPKMRYGFLTNSTPKAVKGIMVDVFNHPQNVDGRFIKAIIVSQIGKEGLSLNHVVETHVLTPPWNSPTLFQAIKRGDRVDSLNYVIELLRLKNMIQKDKLFYSKIFLHVARFNENTLTLFEVSEYFPKYFYLTNKTSEDDIDTFSVDEYVYTRLEMYDKIQKRPIRMLKEIAVDCTLHKQRNVYKDDISGTFECDYSTANYNAYNDIPMKTDTTSFIALSHEEFSLEIIEKLRKIMQRNQMIHITQILDMLNTDNLKFTKEMVYRTIEIIITKKILFKDRLGFDKYLYHNNGYLFLNSSYSKNFNSINFYIGRYSYIPNNPLCTLNLFMKINREEKIKKIINKGEIQYSKITKDELTEIIETIILNNIDKIKENISLDFDNFLSLFEQKEAKILNKYRQFIHFFNEPITKIEKIIDHKINKAKGRGRKPLNKNKKEFKKINLNKALNEGITYEDTNGDGQFIIFHNIKKDCFRTINLNTSFWQNTNDEQNIVYDQMIQYRNILKLKEYEKYSVYGTILEDKKFRIRNKLDEDLQNVMNDSRTVHTGRVAKNLPKKTLIDILYHLNIQPEKMYDKISYNTKKHFLIKKKIISELDNCEKKINFIYAWDKKSTTLMCQKLETYFYENNMMYVF